MSIMNRSIKVVMGLTTAVLLASCNTTRNTNNALLENTMPTSHQPGKEASVAAEEKGLKTEALPQYVQLDNQTNNKQYLLKGGKTAREAGHISSWDLNGAMAVRSKSKAWTASVSWMQQGQNSYQIRLMGPIGSGTVLIQKQGGVVRFQDGAKKASSANADQLLVQQTGVRLPVANLYYWVRGLTAPGGVQSEKRDAAGNLMLLQQAGYTIQFGGYTAVSKAALPTQIRLQGQGVAIKLVIKHWRV